MYNPKERRYTEKEIKQETKYTTSIPLPYKKKGLTATHCESLCEIITTYTREKQENKK